MIGFVDTVQSALIFLGGVVVRLLLALFVLALIAVPVVAWTDLWMRFQGASLRRRLRPVQGLAWRRDVAYAPGHTWVRKRFGRLVVGIDDLARRIVTPVKAVSLPPVGATLRAGEVGAEIRAGDKATPVAAPIDGTVVAVNEDLRQDPTLVERDPYGRGWLYRLAPADTSWPTLRSDEAAWEWFGAESVGLARLLEHELGTAAADGGHLAATLPESLTEDQWVRLTRTFLHAA